MLFYARKHSFFIPQIFPTMTFIISRHNSIFLGEECQGICNNNSVCLTVFMSDASIAFKMKRTWIRFGFVFLLTFVFLYFFFRSVEWKEVLSYLTEVDIKFFILFLVLAPAHWVTRAIRWDYLLMNEKKGVKFFNRFAGNAIGFTVVYLVPGRVGEIVRPLYLAQKENMKKGFVLGTVVVERIFDIFTMCFLLGLFFVFKPLYSSFFQTTEDSYSNLYLFGISGFVFASLVLILSLSLYFFREKTLFLISLFLRPLPKKISMKILEFLKEFIGGLKFFHTAKNLFMYILWSLVVWLGIILHFWLFFYAYNISVPLFSLFPYVFLTMVGAAIPTPGMMGGFHYFSKLGLTSLFQINANLAVGMTIVVHAAPMIVNCLVGYIIFWKEGLSLVQLKKIGKDVEPAS